jgi:hypothetical protein
VLSPVDTRLVGYPYDEGANFGPTGFSLGNDIWQIRETIILEQWPRQERHPYKRKVLWVDKQTYMVLYAAAYDRRGELWKLMYNAHRWSESELQQVKVKGLRTLFLGPCSSSATSS